MQYSVFDSNDFEQLEELQPPNWGPLKPRFEEFIRSPRCHPLKLTDGNKLIAVGTSILHEDSAWLACIIVHSAYRNKGLGAEITRNIMDAIDRQKYSTILLDATDFGYPVYLKLGFEVEGWYAHHRLNGERPQFPRHPAIQSFSPEFEEQLLVLDQQYSSEDRSFLLKKHLSGAKIFVEKNELHGFYLPQLGDGLIVATDPQAGQALMHERMKDFSYAVLPDGQVAAKELLESKHYNEFRKSRRMFLGKKRHWNDLFLYNRISGQLG